MQIRFPVSPEEFRHSYFEKAPLLGRNSFDPKHLDWSVIDQALGAQDVSRERFKVLRSGRIEPEHYLEEFMDVGLRRKRIRKDKLHRLLLEGATIVLNRIEMISPLALDACMQVGRYVGAQTTANAYASLGQETATNVHWDTHDVFVVQLTGCKSWTLYEPTLKLPISSQVSNDRRHELPAEPHLECVLNAGDILYVPRGWWHRVVPVAGHDTIHLAVGVHTPLVLDFLIWACSTHLPELDELRLSLMGGQDDRALLESAIERVTTTLRDPVLLKEFYARSEERDRVVAPFNLNVLLRKRDSALPDATEVSLNARYRVDGGTSDVINGIRLDASPLELILIKALERAPVRTLGDLAAQAREARSDVETAVRRLALADVVTLTLVPDSDSAEQIREVVAVDG